MSLQQRIMNLPVPAPEHWVASSKRAFETGAMHCRLKAESLAAPYDALVEQMAQALQEIADDYADRFDLESPSTNPGIKYTIKQARAALVKHAEVTGK